MRMTIRYDYNDWLQCRIVLIKVLPRITPRHVTLRRIFQAYHRSQQNDPDDKQAICLLYTHYSD